MRRLTFILILFGFLTCSVPGLGQNEISGKISDTQTGEGLPGAHIYCYKNWNIGTSSEPDGSYRLALQALEAGDSLIISMMGYNEVVIRLSELKASAGSISLIPLTRKIEGVTIQGDRLAAQEFHIRKINRLDIYTNPSAKADPLLAVNTLPSSTTTDESANVSFRGSPSYTTGIFLNEVPIYDATRFGHLNGIGTFSIFSPEWLNSLQVFAGNPPLEFGNTSSGLIAMELETRRPERAMHSLAISLASFGVNTTLPIKSRSTLRGFFNYQPSALIKGINPQSLEDIPFFRSVDGGIHLHHQLANQSSIQFFNYSLGENYDFRFQHPTFSGLFNQERFKNISILNWKQPVKNGIFRINGGYTFTQQSFHYSTTTIDLTNADVYISGNYQVEKEKYGIKTGVSFDQRSFDFSGVTPTFEYAIGPEHPTDSTSFSSSIRLPETFGYMRWNPWNKITLGTGMDREYLTALNWPPPTMILCFSLTCHFALN
jgi:hypothetical protein